MGHDPLHLFRVGQLLYFGVGLCVCVGATSNYSSGIMIWYGLKAARRHTFVPSYLTIRQQTIRPLLAGVLFTHSTMSQPIKQVEGPQTTQRQAVTLSHHASSVKVTLSGSADLTQSHSQEKVPSHPP